MFSMEDRRRAVDLYFTESMTIRKVVAKLGYPSEGALAKWLREDPRYTGACRRSYTLECKTNAASRCRPNRCPRPAMTWRSCVGRWRPCGWRTR